MCNKVFIFQDSRTKLPRKGIFVQLKYSENAVTLCEGEEISLICENPPIRGICDDSQPISFELVIREMLLSSEKKMRRVQFIQWTQSEKWKSSFKNATWVIFQIFVLFIFWSLRISCGRGSKIISRSVLSQSW